MQALNLQPYATSVLTRCPSPCVRGVNRARELSSPCVRTHPQRVSLLDIDLDRSRHLTIDPRFELERPGREGRHDRFELATLDLRARVDVVPASANLDDLAV